jgi:cation diffusion facilitator CzcD-associated flavoprotein CzcO
MNEQHRYQWMVVGAGPAGMTAVGKLLDRGVSGEDIVWVDPHFAVGDLAARWPNVSSNTTVKLFIDFLKATKAFDYERVASPCTLESLDASGTCLLKHVVTPLQNISDHLRQRVVAMPAMVSQLEADAEGWQAQLSSGPVLLVDQVILAPGSLPNRLSYDAPILDLETALDPVALPEAVSAGERMAVFGSSHSAVLVMKNLLAQGCEVVNFYKSPVRYAVYHEGWIEFDNTGLKGMAAHWAKANLAGEKLPQGLTRYLSDAAHISKHLPLCQKVVYATGFTRREVPVQSVDVNQYNPETGELAPGLYGCGLAYPEFVTDRKGHEEWSVGLWKFHNYLERVVTNWVKATALP